MLVTCLHYVILLHVLNTTEASDVLQYLRLLVWNMHMHLSDVFHYLFSMALNRPALIRLVQLSCLSICLLVFRCVHVCVLGCFWLRKKSQKMRKSTSIWPCYPWMIGNLRKHGNGSTKLSRWRQRFHVLVCKMNFWRKKNLKISFTSALHIIRRASNQASSNAVFNVWIYMK